MTIQQLTHLEELILELIQARSPKPTIKRRVWKAFHEDFSSAEIDLSLDTLLKRGLIVQQNYENERFDLTFFYPAAQEAKA
jgi:hypothetical protein